MTSDPNHPGHPDYLDEAAGRAELTRAFDLCLGCRRCTDLCASFPRLFDLVDAGSAVEAGDLTPAQQDHVVDGCFHCRRCAIGCPYGPDVAADEPTLHLPTVMRRAAAMQVAHGHVERSRRNAVQLVARATDRSGVVGTVIGAAADRVAGAEPGSLVRRSVERVAGLSATRVLPPTARERFSRWFGRRPRVRLGKKQGAVTILPTCLVEYHEPAIGRDLVRVYEHNGIECGVSAAGCCGAPWLDGGELDRFREVAERNVRHLADEVRAGTELVVPQSTCCRVVREEYPTHVGERLRADAELVAAHTHDASAYLLALHRRPDAALDMTFDGSPERAVTYHAACHARSAGAGLPGRDLVRLTGAHVSVVSGCSGAGGGAGLRVDGAPMSLTLAQQLGDAVADAPADVVVGDCHLANTVIGEQTGRAVLHPVQLLARAYGLPTD